MILVFIFKLVEAVPIHRVHSVDALVHSGTDVCFLETVDLHLRHSQFSGNLLPSCDLGSKPLEI